MNPMTNMDFLKSLVGKFCVGDGDVGVKMKKGLDYF
jgi:hypothetical protein